MAPPKDSLSTAPLTPPLTGLQAHLAFFDRDGDGVLWPLDTYVGFRAIGSGYLVSIASMIIIHFVISWLTVESHIPDPLFRVYIKRIHRAVHGSDSRSYSKRGEIDDARLAEIFETYTDPPHDSINVRQMIRFMKGNAGPFDPFGWFGTITEWGALIILLGSPLKRDDVKAALDGSLWPRLAAKNAKENNI